MGNRRQCDSNPNAKDIINFTLFYQAGEILLLLEDSPKSKRMISEISIKTKLKSSN